MPRTSLGILRKARLPDEQARAIVEAMEIERVAHQQSLATRADLRELEFTLQATIASFREEMKDQLNELRLMIQTQRADTARWILASAGALLGAFGVMLGLFYFFLNYVRR